jgi:ribosomal protein S12 methylthiotransferase accessory factor
MEHGSGERASVFTQSGERSLALTDAYARGAAAIAQLGLDFELSPLLDADPGAWVCVLSQQGRPLLRGVGGGKGASAVARVGALFEALEHHLSGLDGIESTSLVLRPAHEVADGPLARDIAVAMLAEGGTEAIACWPFRSMVAPNDEADVPVFLSVPEYVEGEGASLRRQLGDTYDYGRVRRYSCNSGWAAGSDPAEAAVHALNEAIERDALSLLLVNQFLGLRRLPLRVIAPDSLPADLAGLFARTQEITGSPIHLIDMTTDLGVPAILAFLPPTPGKRARIRGCGASLSRGYAIERSLTELAQLYLGEASDPVLTPPPDQTLPYPVLHRCSLADFSPFLARAESIAFRETRVPGSPQEHLARLVETLTSHGFTPYLREHRVLNGLAVVNVVVPGLERFMLITDGILVVPGERGRQVRQQGLGPNFPDPDHHGQVMHATRHSVL